ncbi:hypothetical protein COT70_00365 [candidate division WWE3 bacterium CG09_land_8_20_14_0_10_47_33]|uniref:GIY-YIG domain-containing protein n=1 Tax=candidate division WWE3 bacterium CG_4_9_14_0_2_um_filter_48_10 TaxID=1975078 RepID=A0A2M8EJX1_UNCKA|nr:MAG: hypothetical protein COT70_00365 [candidate division WWE3 bacterium CG09_land_8_20_14_0_10_47_33]PIZ41211.1 MAG: hypothetical protein COY35_00830 [candidate division WWE3 bacterium CG_4_10_14_0_2_um_filter_47_8]PJC23020.1 MAG: hypothetical protein CO059_00930 [candidate division WWE3 bacterium CG_4_9_14_0_2_um_filter_48_10]
MYYVYLLQSRETRTFYIGCTQNLEERIKQHNLGKVRSTKNKRPLNLVCAEEFYNKREAYRREKELKTKYTEKRKLLARIGLA